MRITVVSTCHTHSIQKYLLTWNWFPILVNNSLVANVSAWWYNQALGDIIKHLVTSFKAEKQTSPLMGNSYAVIVGYLFTSD